MTMFGHFVVECALRHNAAIRAAMAIDPATIGSGRTKAEAEVSRLSCRFFDKLHDVEKLVRIYGVDEVFGPRTAPLTEEQKLPILR
jgi:hypothetical protein